MGAMASNVLSTVGGGRPRKPTRLKLLAGTLQKCRTNPREPTAKPKNLPRPPDYLTERQRAEWRRLAKVINPMKICTKQDFMAFESLVTQYTLRRQAEESLYAGGNTATVYARKTKDGMVLTKRPEVEQIAQADKHLAYWMSRFGMSPADRSRVSTLGDAKKADALDEFRE